MTVIGLLLLLQAAALLAGGGLHVLPLPRQWPLAPEAWQAKGLDLVTGVIFGLLALAALLAAVTFFRVARGARLYGLLVQGLSLLMALNLYFRGKPPHAYVLMLYGVVMVVYLHQGDVQAAFRPRPEQARRRGN